MFAACILSAIATVFILSLSARAAKARVGEQYVSPDYIRYISQGYWLDTVSLKKNYLVTVTDGDLPVRVHIFTVDGDKNTLDVLELPPNGYISADGFCGTLCEAYQTSVYKEIVAAAFRIKIDGSLSFSAETFGDGAKLLKTRVGKEAAEEAAKDWQAYIRGDIRAVFDYRKALADILKNIGDLGAQQSFAVLMNLILNRFDTDMTVEDIISAENLSKDIKTDKIYIRFPAGGAATVNGEQVWAFDREKTAELLNKHFRVKGKEYPAEALGLPDLCAGEYLFGDIPENIEDILKT